MISIKFQDTKLCKKKSVALLYTYNILADSQIKNTIPFAIDTKNLKHLRIQLLEEVNYKTVLKEIRDDTNKWKHSIFMNWKNQCYQSGHTVQFIVTILFHKTTDSIFHRMKKKVF